VRPPSSVLYVPGPPRWARDALIQELRTRLPEPVQQAFLFGSHARETADGDSDIDLIFVVDTDVPSVRRPLAFVDVLQGLGALDLLVYTPAEWEGLNRAPSSFMEQIRAELLRIK